jgi:hypothetical protein
LSIALKSLLGLGALILAACSTVGGNVESQKLVGRWRSTNERHVAEYAFFGDGTFTGFVATEGSMLSQFTGRWHLRGGSIQYDYTSDKMGRIPAGTKDRDKLIRVNRDYFVIEAADGGIREYKRIGGG